MLAEADLRTPHRDNGRLGDAALPSLAHRCRQPLVGADLRAPRRDQLSFAAVHF